MELLRINLEQYELPKFWYNITADLPNKLAPALDIHGNPASLDDMAKIFPHTILEQDVFKQFPDKAVVLSKVRGVQFVMAGGGDMMEKMIRLAARRGISDRFHFAELIVWKKFWELRQKFITNMKECLPPDHINQIQQFHKRITTNSPE